MRKSEILRRVRDIQRATLAVEACLLDEYGICLNEGMLLCTIMSSEEGILASGDIGVRMGLTPSNVSKVIRSVESKGLVVRSTGSMDRRQMYFRLTDEGHRMIKAIENCRMEVPELLADFLNK